MKPAVGSWRHISEHRALFFLLAILCATWLAIVLRWSVPFWQAYDEYVYEALADALNLEVWLRSGVHFEDSNLGTHPGVPFYLISWLSLRATALLTGHGDVVSYALHEPDAFHLATRIAAGLITFSAILGGWRILSPLAPTLRALALFSFFAADPSSLIYGLTFLAVETFALPIAVLMFWAVKRISYARQEMMAPWILCGAVAALGYLVKLTYIYVLLGMIVLVFVRALQLQVRVRDKALFVASRLAIVVGTFIVVATGVLLALVGWRGLHDLLQTHIGLLFAERGGSGPSVSIKKMGVALDYFVTTRAILPMIVAALAVLAYTAYSEWRVGSLDERKTLWLAVAVTALGFTTFVILNHFHDFYIPAISALLPFVWKPSLDRPISAKIATPLFAVAAVFTVLETAGFYQHMDQQSKNMQADEQTILALPLRPNEARLWTYRTPSKYFVEELILQFAGLQDYVRGGEPITKDYSSYANVPRAYRYIIFDRRYHPTADMISQDAARGNLIEPNGMKVAVSPRADYRELRATIVVENPGE
jgi:hypothetical protein